jgi:hypothetical protein
MARWPRRAFRRFDHQGAGLVPALFRFKESGMSQEALFRARAVEARQDADTTILPQVKDRCLRAAAAWDVMAERERKTVAARAKREAERIIVELPAAQ